MNYCVKQEESMELQSWLSNLGHFAGAVAHYAVITAPEWLPFVFI